MELDCNCQNYNTCTENVKIFSASNFCCSKLEQKQRSPKTNSMADVLTPQMTNAEGSINICTACIYSAGIST